MSHDNFLGGHHGGGGTLPLPGGHGSMRDRDQMNPYGTYGVSVNINLILWLCGSHKIASVLEILAYLELSIQYILWLAKS